MELPSIEKVEEVLLGWFWLVSTKWRDRSPQSMLEFVNELTGLPDRAQDLVPRYKALAGASLALAVTPTPRGLASSWLRYHATPNMPCNGTATCEGCRELSLKPAAQWDDEELDTVNELTYRIKRAVHSLAIKGFMDPQPPDMDGVKMPLDVDGMTMRFGVTPAGLEYAREKFPGTEYESMVRGWREAVTKAEFAKAPSWLTGGG